MTKRVFRTIAVCTTIKLCCASSLAQEKRHDSEQNDRLRSRRVRFNLCSTFGEYERLSDSLQKVIRAKQCEEIDRKDQRAQTFSRANITHDRKEPLQKVLPRLQISTNGCRIRYCRRGVCNPSGFVSNVPINPRRRIVISRIDAS